MVSPQFLGVLLPVREPQNVWRGLVLLCRGIPVPTLQAQGDGNVRLLQKLSEQERSAWRPGLLALLLRIIIQIRAHAAHLSCHRTDCSP